MELEMLREVVRQQMGTDEATAELFSKVLFHFVIICVFGTILLHV
jgi:hypothetical protein